MRRLAALLAIAPALWATQHDDKGFGLQVGTTVTAHDVGLPVYPGAHPYKDNSENDPAVQMSAWAGASGFKLAVMKLETGDSAEKVIEFYRKALNKYGPVLNCSDRNGPSRSGDLTCEDEHSKKDEVLLKAGTKADQHNVAISREKQSTIIALVYVRGDK